MDLIILHGTKGSPEGNWFQWLKEKAEESGYRVFIPRLPTPENQSKDNWCEALRNQAPVFGHDTILAGHSLGATFMLHILEVVQEPIAKSIFVSPVIDKLGIEEYDTLNKSFLKTPDFDWSTISNNAGEIVYFHGNNDPYVPLEQSQTLQRKLGGELLVIPEGGHLNSESGYTEFPEILEHLPNINCAKAKKCQNAKT